jgi:hypothetical protein
MPALTKRMVIRLGDELDAWIAAKAEREGLDNAAWVRSVLTKMMNGIMPMPRGDLERRLVSPGTSSRGVQEPTQPQISLDPDQPAGNIDALLETRAHEAAESVAPPLFVTPPPADENLTHELVGTAYPLRRIERSRYNPGRGGYG